MKLSEFKDEEALDLIAELIEPASKIFSNTDLRDAVRGGKSRLEIAKIAVKSNKKEVFEILCLTSGVPMEEYHCTPVSILKQFMEMIDDEELLDFFSSMAQTEEANS